MGGSRSYFIKFDVILTKLFNDWKKTKSSNQDSVTFCIQLEKLISAKNFSLLVSRKKKKKKPVCSVVRINSRVKIKNFFLSYTVLR